jgi:primosomal protein N' (replication factor Y)
LSRLSSAETDASASSAITENLRFLSERKFAKVSLVMKLPVVAVAVPRHIDQTFDYCVPQAFIEKIRLGQRVLVDFGKEKLEGFVVALKEVSEYQGALRPLRSILDAEPVFEERDFALARWISEYYLAPLGLVLRAIAPSRKRGVREGRQVQFVRLAQDLAQTMAEIDRLAKRAPQQAALLMRLLTVENVTERELLERVGCSPRPLQHLVATKWVALDKKPYRSWTEEFHEEARSVELTPDQRAAIGTIGQALLGPGEKFLLHGVNGSGKTEVYMQIAQRALERGKQAIVLVPEISLTPQLLARFRHRFGEMIAIYHSGLTESEKARQWERVLRGEAQIAVGVRSAIFAPFDRLGLVVVDEEHESTYKQEDPAPRYHVREIALRRAQIENATVVLGSATPSLETYYYAQAGLYQFLEMKRRAVGGAPPQIQIVPLDETDTLLSRPLQEKISQRLARGEQVILLLNRLGYAYAVCEGCREVVRCPSCGIPLTLHLRGQRLDCRYCSYELKLPKCRRCGSSRLRYYGAGTERLELELRRLFRTVGLHRMDSESVQRGQHGAILEEFRQGKIQILLGTQMIGLGLDFPNVTLVGVISADTLLDLPDFRAGERTFQLISQAAGRAGRGEKGGEVIIQTRHPEHYAIQCAARGDYQKFYQEEIAFRREFDYPPCTQLIELIVHGTREEKALQSSVTLKDALNKLGGAELVGPAKALPYRLRGHYRWRLLIKSRGVGIKEGLRAVIRDLKLAEHVTINVDPQL